MADGQGEAAWGTSGQVTIGMMEQWNAGTKLIFVRFIYGFHNEICSLFANP